MFHLLFSLGRGWCMSWTQQESCWLTWGLTKLPATTPSTGGTTQCSWALRRESSSSPPTQGSSGRWYKRGKGCDNASSSVTIPLSLIALQGLQSWGMIHYWKERVNWEVWAKVEARTVMFSFPIFFSACFVNYLNCSAVL